jgi:hypothetical protein
VPAAEVGIDRGSKNRVIIIFFISVLTVGGILDDDLVLRQLRLPGAQSGWKRGWGRGRC